MKNLQPHVLNAQTCRSEWNKFAALLTAQPTLSEQKDVLPFFKNSKDLSLLICSYFPKIKAPDHFAHEYELDGDFVADLVVMCEVIGGLDLRKVAANQQREVLAILEERQDVLLLR